MSNWSALDAALEYARRGWYVFPIRPGTKEPYGGFAWKEKSTNNPEVIKKASEGIYKNCNWALDCGKSNLYVIDVDGEAGKSSMDLLAISSPFTVKTPSGGLHLYFEGPGPTSSKTIAPGIDSRGAGGYVLIPGSTVNGSGYSLVSDFPIGPAPDEWKPKKADIKTTEPITSFDNPAHVKTAVLYLLNEAPEAIEGQGGDETTYKVAARVRDLGISEQKAFELMADFWNPEKASPSWDHDELRKKIEHAYRYAQNPPGCATPEAMFSSHSLMKNLRRASEISVKDIKPYNWLIQGRYLPGFYTVTVAQGGAGKSRLALLEAISVSTGRHLCHGVIAKKGPVWIYNAEDPYDEIERRIHATCRFYDIPQTELSDLYYTSGYESPFKLAKIDEKGRPVVNEAVIESIVSRIKELGVVLFILDPFVECHDIPENSTQMSIVVQVLRRIAEGSGAAVSVIHHTKKGLTEAGDMDSARGSSTVVYGARLAHTILGMTEKEGKQFGVGPGGHKWHLRMDNAKSNFTAPADKCDWYRLRSVPVFTDSDQTVGTLERVELSTVVEKGPADLIVDRVFQLLPYGEPRTLNSIARTIHAEKLVKGSKTAVYEMVEEAFLASVHRDAEVVSLILIQDAMGDPVKHLEKTFDMV